MTPREPPRSPKNKQIPPLEKATARFDAGEADEGFFDCSRATSSQAHSLVISADWNAYELTKGNDDAYGQTVRRRVVLEM